MNADEHRLNQLTQAVIGCAYDVSNSLGCGYVEKVYQNAMVRALSRSGIRAEKEVLIEVYFDSVVVGEFYADLVVEGMVLVELKAVRELDELHWAQCLNYLKASGLTVCLLINFGNPKVQIKRFVGSQRGRE
jgi:GxxExxY protein